MAFDRRHPQHLDRRGPRRRSATRSSSPTTASTCAVRQSAIASQLDLARDPRAPRPRRASRRTACSAIRRCSRIPMASLTFGPAAARRQQRQQRQINSNGNSTRRAKAQTASAFTEQLKLASQRAQPLLVPVSDDMLVLVTSRHPARPCWRCRWPPARAMQQQPYTQDETASAPRPTRSRCTPTQEPVTGPITFYEAAARALKYNLDYRLKLMESALAANLRDVSSYEMLPRLVASAGHLGSQQRFGRHLDRHRGPAGEPAPVDLRGALSQHRAASA